MQIPFTKTFYHLIIFILTIAKRMLFQFSPVNKLWIIYFRNSRQNFILVDIFLFEQ